MYRWAKGVPQGYTKALEWLEKAAAQGHASAQYNLGLMHSNGWGVLKDDTKAVEWYRKAAAQGDLDVQDVLNKIRR